MQQQDALPHLFTNMAYAAAAWFGFALDMPAARTVAISIAILQAAFALLFIWPALRKGFIRSPARTPWSLQFTHACRFAAAATFAAFNSYLLASVALLTAGVVLIMHCLRAQMARTVGQSA